MNTPAVAARFALITVFNRYFVIAALSAFVTFNVSAQIPSATDGSTPLGIAPGSPAGSYALSDFEHINLYNGNPDVRVPLLQVNARGAANMTMMASVQLEPWIVKHGAGGPYASHNWWTGIKPGYGPGVLQGRHARGEFSTFCSQDNSSHYNQTLTRLTFSASDGTEFELRDQLLGGQPSTLPFPCAGHASRGTVFVTADGSAATFVSDVTIYDQINIYDPYVGAGPLIYPSGYLMLRDGVRYRIDNGLVTCMRDRNGNRLSFVYDGNKRVTLITDSLNRQVTVSYANFTSVFYDQITYYGFGGAPRYIKVWWSNLSSALRSDYPLPLKTVNELFLLAYDASVYNPRLISAIELPDGRQYHFYYNYYGEVARVETPTGGAFEYDMTPDSGVIDNGSEFYGIYRRLQKRRVYPNGRAGNSYSIETTYSLATSPGGADPTTVTVEQRDTSGGLKAADKHYFSGIASDSLFQGAVVYPAWKDGREYKTESLDVNGVTVIRRADNDWQQRAPVSWWTGPASNAPPNDVRLSAVTNTLADTNQVSKQTFTYDDTVPYNNRQDVYEYDYGVGGAPTYPTRHTHTDYVKTYNGANYDADFNIHLRSLSLVQITYAVNPANGAETWAAQTNYEYDKYDASANHAALVNRSGISGLDGSFTTGYQPRGNPTQVDHWLNSSGSLLVSSWAQYDIAGNVVKVVDGSGNASNLDFTDRFGSPDGEAQANAGGAELAGQTSYAFPTKITNALGHEAYTQFDYYLGKPVEREDANGTVSSLYYNDALDRPTQLVRAVNQATVKTQTTVSYDDANRTITATSDRDNFNDNLLQKNVRYDGLGRTWRAATYEGASLGWSIVDTEFDALGRAYRVSNPYRATDVFGAINPSGVWSTSNYDALSRVIETQTTDGAKMRTAYDGARVLVTEPYNESLPLGQQNRKQRISESDALDRLRTVWEVKASDSATEGVTFPGHSEITAGYKTTYQYDALDNLTTVTQRAGAGGTLQTRSFAYDSLKRLTSATNPESGLITYIYDENSNLKEKTDARGITVNFNYDALNRMTSDSYTSYPNGSAGSVFLYDNPDLSKNGKGRFWHNYNYTTLPSGELKYSYNYIDAYDALGRPTMKTQKFLTRDCVGCSYYTKDYAITRTYDRAGNVKSQIYPSGRTVDYSYDAAGRLNEFKGKLGGTPTDVFYAKDIRYNARGQMTREEFGVNPGGHHTALYHRMYYNRRGQMFDTRLGTDGSSVWDVEDPLVWRWANGTWNRGAIRLFYSASFNDYDSVNPSQPDNNGNIYGTDHFVPNALDGGGNVTSWVMGSDAYLYDEVNRLTQVTETPTGGSGPGFVQKFIYDRWGNRKIDTAATSNVGGGVTDIDFQVNTANNRLLAPTDTGAPSDKMRYDAAGNLIWDEYSNPTNPSRDLGYDVKNRIGVVKNSLGAELARYLYDPDGRRVRRIVGVIETWLVYGIDGELIAEYSYNSGASSPQKEYGYRGKELLVVWDVTETGNRQWQWLVSDQLGSPRMVVDRGGEVTGIRRRDFMPFGEELASGIGHRNAAGAGYIADNVRQRFGSKERDIETGLDFFIARYYASTQGRFLSPDEFTGGPDELFDFADVASDNPTFYADLTNPQSLNKYQYTYNSPLRYTDPDGHCPVCPAAQRLLQTPTAQELARKAAPYVAAGVAAVAAAASGALDKVEEGLEWLSKNAHIDEDPEAIMFRQWQEAMQGMLNKNSQPQTATPSQTQAQPQTAKPVEMARPIDKPRKQGHRKGKKHDKHTKVPAGDKKPPNYIPFRHPPKKQPKPSPTPMPNKGPKKKPD